ncbi:alpha-amylase family glycosyl hydrolase [Bifidobacterium leontopitheci]|uniref:Alpha-amylase n=1 Tax=Bifidobacterium leontopitheci TaxID=2650774 RepID=A0A6I1GDD7_9BIFI|nr:alpha-amylase family glycosyl hydrolase [Bifidobacterium leontopitheci]KAB7789634.1 alpha-amylase [Bifidobacterium leontopitheci]
MEDTRHTEPRNAAHTARTTPRWLRDARFYEIYPQSFADSNGDGIGDIPGIIGRLDYIRELGCNALWINPCYDSPFKDAGYDVRDYTRIAPRYGTNDDMVRLFGEAHRRGIRVLLDLVPGHTSEEHPWFQASAKSDHADRHLPGDARTLSERYIWTDSWIAGGDGLPFIGGECERNGTYILNFFKCQPALNYGFAHPRQPWQKPALGPDALATCEAIADVMRFWLGLGADGFRVDMADSLVKRDDEPGVVDGWTTRKPFTIRTWRTIFEQVRTEFPEAAFVSEWGRPYESLLAGFDMDFYLDWRWDGKPNGYNMLLRDTDTPAERSSDDRSYFNADSGTGIEGFLGQYLPQLRDAERLGGYFDLITCNHDTPRVAGRLTDREIALAYATLLTLPGVPFVYYGDEIGMRYRQLPSKEGGYVRTGSRTPMQWDGGRNLGFSTAAADALYLPVDDDAAAPTVASQQADGGSLWHVVHDVLALRASTAALRADAGFAPITESGRLFAFRRFVRTACADAAADGDATGKAVCDMTGSRADGNKADGSKTDSDMTDSSRADADIVVAVNPGRTTLSLDLRGDAAAADSGTTAGIAHTPGSVVFAIGEPSYADGTLVMPPQSFAILR